jgi:hypothetical protein
MSMSKTQAARTLATGDAATRLPTQDPQRARRSHAETLGLEPIDERPRGPRHSDPAPRTDENGLHGLAGGKVAWFGDPDGRTFTIEEGAAP